MEHWEKFLNPKVLRGNLISASIFISAYEICRSSVIDKPKSFFIDSCTPAHDQVSQEYRSKVLSLAKSPLEASLLWFKGMGAIEDNDIAKLSDARKLRNQLAHDLPAFLTDTKYEIERKIFDGLLEVTRKIGVWWVVNVELPANPDYDSEEIDEREIKTGTLIMLQMMMEIAYGEEPEEGYYYRHYRKQQSS